MENRMVNLLKVCTLFGFLQNTPLTLCFNVDILHPRVFNPRQTGSHFGHRVCKFGPTNDSVLVTAPVLGKGTGGVYMCSYYSGLCEALPFREYPGIAFGLSLSCNADKAIVCGPRLSHDCDGLQYLNGLCLQYRPELTVSRTWKPAFQECHNTELDAVILFDDSQSISTRDFKTMIAFIKSIIRMFTNPRWQVAVAKYSTNVHAVFQFENFAVDRNADSLMQSVQHSKGHTYTPSAIGFVLNDMLREDKGMRKNSKKLLVVITDGRSNDRNVKFSDVIPVAERMGVTRYAIGVGNEYSRQELELIASSQNDVFEANSFSALSSIQKQLGEKIFAIEGTDKSNFSAFQLEISQGGFSTALTQDTLLFGAVGAFEWSGGIVENTLGANDSFINASAQEPDIKDSYLGYSVTTAEVNGTRLYFVGAPRYRHQGLVLGFQKNHPHHNWTVSHRIYGTQLGSYFGAEVCVLDVSGQGQVRQLLLVGAPHYHSNAVGGEVRVCALESEPQAPFTLDCSPSLRGSPGNDLGQFGSSLSPCPDLNGDGVPELLVGAPQENGGRGSLYIFLGRLGGIQMNYSQKVQGVSVGHGLHYFGVSVHSAGDLNLDGLADLVVGARGMAVILRSQPVICVTVSVSLDPPIIPQDSFHCAAYHATRNPVSVATVCVNITGIHTGNIQSVALLRGSVSIMLELDPQTRPARLLFSPSSVLSHWNGTVSSVACYNLPISILDCISDYEAVPLSGQLTFEGHEIEGTEGLKPVLSPDCPKSFSHLVLLEQVCGEDQVCVSDLQVSFNCTSLTLVRSPGYPLALLVKLANSGEDASGTELTLIHPSSLTFARATKSSRQASLWCVSNSTGRGGYTHTVCQLGSTVFRQRTSIPVLAFLSVSDPSSLADGVTVNVSIGSKNENSKTLLDNTASCFVPVLLPVNVILKEGDSTQYLSFKDSRQLIHEYKVENVGETAVPVTVSFGMLVEIAPGLLWNVSLAVRPDPENRSRVQCVRNITGPSLKQFCTIDLLTVNRTITFKFHGNVMGDVKASDERIRSMSWGFLSFDPLRYIQFPADKFHNLSVVSVLEPTPAGQTAKYVIATIVPGLIILIITLLILYKVGFLKAKEPEEGQIGETVSPPEDKETEL